MRPSIKTVVERAGGARRVAEMLGVSHQAVYYWVSRGWFPPARAVQLSRRFKVPKSELIDPKLAKLLTA